MPQRGTLGPERCSKCGSLLYIDGDGAQPCLKCEEMRVGDRSYVPDMLKGV